MFSQYVRKSQNWQQQSWHSAGLSMAFFGPSFLRFSMSQLQNIRLAYHFCAPNILDGYDSEQLVVIKSHRLGSQVHFQRSLDWMLKHSQAVERWRPSRVKYEVHIVRPVGCSGPQRPGLHPLRIHFLQPLGTGSP